MSPAFQFSPLFLALQVVSVAVMIITPIILAVVFTRRFGLSWRYVGYGALIFVLSQMVLRIPLVAALQTSIGPALQASFALTALFALGLAITAGLFESVGRYIGYRWLMRREAKTWEKGVLYGIGHGGIESLLLISAIAITQLVTMTTISEAQLATLPAATAEALRATAVSWNALPLWLSLGGAVERIAAIAFHIAMSVVVLQVFVRGELRWLWYAVAAHSTFDFVMPFLFPLLISDPIARGVLIYLIYAVLTAGAVVVIRALRTPTPSEAPRSHPFPGVAETER